jgi:cystathionine beta-lyase
VADPLPDVSLPELRRRRSLKWTKHPDDVLPAFVAEMDVRVAEPVRAVLRAAVDDDDLGYATPGRLPEAFAGFAARRWDWVVDPDDVFLVPDVVSGIAEVLRLVTRPGDGVVIDPPVYPPFRAVIAEVERRVVEMPLSRGADGRGALDLHGLEAAFAAGARAYVLCNPQNPTGDLWSRESLAEVARVAERHGVTVLSDEIHAPLTLDGSPHTPYATVAQDCVVLTSARSRSTSRG